MPDLHLKGVPVKLHLKIKKSARENRRSLNSEAIFRLEQAYGMQPSFDSTPRAPKVPKDKS